MKLPDSWKENRLKDIAVHKTAKNKDLKYTETYTNSATLGIVRQMDYFDKEISNKENIAGYYIVEEGDYVYNPRISASAPCGPIRKSHIKETGIMSPLYTVFKITEKNLSDDYLEQYFKSTFWHSYMKTVANYGARYDRMNITTEDFFNIPIPFPPLAEQQKIAEILCKQDKIISSKQKLLEQKLQQKKWLMQKLLEIPLTDANDEEKFSLGGVVIDKSGWKKEILGNLLDFKNGINSDKEKYGYGIKMISVMDILSDNPITLDSIKSSVEISDDELKTYSVTYGDILFQRSSENYEDAGSSNVYIDGKHTVTFSGFVIRGKKKGDYEPLCLNAILNTDSNRSQIRKKAAGAQHINIGQDSLKSIQIYLPSLPEQKIIAQVLSTADKEIALLKSSIEQEKQKKKSLAQLLLTGTVRVKI